MSVEAYISSMFSPWHWALLAVFVLFFAAYGVGSFVNTKVPVIDFSFGIYGLSLLGLTISLQLPSAILLVVMLLFAVWGAYRFFSLLKFQWLHLLIIAIGAITLGSALLPPFLWDEQVYQVALPWHYLQNRSTAVLIDNPYSAYPALPHFFS